MSPIVDYKFCPPHRSVYEKLYADHAESFAGRLFPFLLEGRILPMTSEQAWKELRDLERDGKKKFTEPQKRALEYAMVLIAQKVGEDILNRKEGTSA